MLDVYQNYYIMTIHIYIYIHKERETQRERERERERVIYIYIYIYTIGLSQTVELRIYQGYNELINNTWLSSE